jgi:hypothetical protein
LATGGSSNTATKGSSITAIPQSSKLVQEGTSKGSLVTHSTARQYEQVRLDASVSMAPDTDLVCVAAPSQETKVSGRSCPIC